MKCLKISCEKEAKSGFEACGPLHGADIKMFRKNIMEDFDADLARNYTTRELFTIEEVITYAV